MNPEVSSTIKNHIHQVIKAIKSRNAIKLRRLSDTSVRNASIYQDEDSVSFAVIIYSLSKIIERNRDDESKSLIRFYDDVCSSLKRIRGFIEDDNEDKYKAQLKSVFSSIEEIDDQLATYIQEIIEKSRINKGSSMMDNGISSAQSAQIMGISRWALIDYLGKTRAFDLEIEGIPIKDRLDFAMSLFEAK